MNTTDKLTQLTKIFGFRKTSRPSSLQHLLQIKISLNRIDPKCLSRARPATHRSSGSFVQSLILFLKLL